jgi:hypothetical protein
MIATELYMGQQGLRLLKNYGKEYFSAQGSYTVGPPNCTPDMQRLQQYQLMRE